MLKLPERTPPVRTALKLPIVCTLLFLFFCGQGSNAFGETWDEPWHKEVVAKADTFGLFEVMSSKSSRVVFKKVRHLAGIETPDTIEVDGYSEGVPRSPSRFYLFLKKAPSGCAWRLTTPTSGYAEVGKDGKVVATYRISVHLAQVDPDIYESTQTCIFLKLHKQEKCGADVYKFIDSQLAMEQATWGDRPTAVQLDQFYTQHAAMETAYLIGYPVSADTLSKFLGSSIFHVQVSAVRALSVSEVKDRNQRLLNFAMDSTKTGIARVMAVFMLRDLDARELKDKIIAYIPMAPTEETGLGIAIMDPRIGTNYPESVKEALQDLVKKWQ